jgi:hypothetical protein
MFQTIEGEPFYFPSSTRHVMFFPTSEPALNTTKNAAGRHRRSGRDQQLILTQWERLQTRKQGMAWTN